MSTCPVAFGSHGCDLPAGHDPEDPHPVHECRDLEWLCSQAQVRDGVTYIRQQIEPDTWDDWRPYGLDIVNEEPREHPSASA